MFIILYIVALIIVCDGSVTNTNEEISWPSLLKYDSCDNVVQITSVFCDRLSSDTCVSSVISFGGTSLVPSSCVDYNNGDSRKRCFYSVSDFGTSLNLLEIKQIFGVSISYTVFKPPTLCNVIRRYRQYVHLGEPLFKKYCIVELISYPVVSQ